MSNFLKRDSKRRVNYLKTFRLRETLRTKLKDRSVSMQERYQMQIKLNQLAKDSSKIRLSNRCIKSGRTHSVLKVFRLSRIELRGYINEGSVNGFKKSSW